MPRFVIEREIEGAGDMTPEQLEAAASASLAALQSLGPKIQWIHSYLTDSKIYCVYIAPDEETILEHAGMAGIPANRISRVRALLEPANYA
jgi:hypothetical protein